MEPLGGETLQLITRKCEFDYGHRVMNERMKCFNIHGHRGILELTFAFVNMDEIGYAIDFKEIKRVGCQWIDDIMDHALLLNPTDKVLVDAAEELASKYWLMSLNGYGKYCNPTVENLAKEIYLAMEILFVNRDDLFINSIRLYETPNCYTDCFEPSITSEEREHFYDAKGETVEEYAKQKGIVEYDDRKLKK